MRTSLALSVVWAVLVPAACSEQATPLELAAAGDVGGAVMATDSGRVATTILSLEASAGGILTAQTDAGGSYFFSAVAVGSWTLTITPPVGFVLAPGETQTKPVVVTEGQFTQIDFQLSATAR